MDAYLERNSTITLRNPMSYNDPTAPHRAPIHPLYTSMANPASTVTTTSYTTTASAPNMAGMSTIGILGPSMWKSEPQNIFSISDKSGKPVMVMDHEGNITFNIDTNVPEAAEIFVSSIYLSTEAKAGITLKTKQKIRDAVFNDIIEIAKRKGTLDAEELTSMLEASKIMEKLKGE